MQITNLEFADQFLNMTSFADLKVGSPYALYEKALDGHYKYVNLMITELDYNRIVLYDFEEDDVFTEKRRDLGDFSNYGKTWYLA